MKIFSVLIMAVMLTGCSTLQKYWPRAHDPQLVRLWVDTQIALNKVDCSAADRGWHRVSESADTLALYAEFRRDPQAENVKGLAQHADKMNRGGSPAFCELGKKTAEGRLSAARKAWEGR